MSAPLLVADSGPLIALARLNLLSLPVALFDDLLVTATVWHEVSRYPREADRAALSAAFERGLVSVVDDPAQLPAHPYDPQLDQGERSALALALDRGAVVLIDERRGRAAAAALGLPVIGTLGLLVRAHSQGLIAQIRPLAVTLMASGYFLTPALVERALASIGE